MPVDSPVNSAAARVAVLFAESRFRARNPFHPAAYKDIFISDGDAMADSATLVGALRAAGEGTRLRLLALLADGEHSV